MEPGSGSVPLFIDEAARPIHDWLQRLDPGVSLDVANAMQNLRRLNQWEDLAFFESGIGDRLDDAESILLSRIVGKKLLHLI
ncbi:hypothetical protein [uncultured Hyphomonas sp.]|uniref:hypothetical protein n=1 Tax=uncultured Hyphomonas sp. TaxID=225298 RepID=UPI002AAB209C|nr:hypothetical protein [uncultured Hyphomonas sp.]